MSHSCAPGELPRTRETAAGPAGNWPCSSPDILRNVELFESKRNKSFANVNINDWGKGLLLKEKLRILGAYWVIFWRAILLGCYGNDEDKIIVIFLMIALMSSSTAIGWKKLLLKSRWLLLCHVLFLFLLYLNLQTYLFKSVHGSSWTIFYVSMKEPLLLKFIPFIICFLCHRFQLERVYPGESEILCTFLMGWRGKLCSVGQRPVDLGQVSPLPYLAVPTQGNQ